MRHNRDCRRSFRHNEYYARTVSREGLVTRVTKEARVTRAPEVTGVTLVTKVTRVTRETRGD